MFKNTIAFTTLCALPVFNEYIKTQVTKTKSFAQTITNIQKELNQINVKISSQSTQLTQSSSSLQTSQTQNLYNLILTPQIQKLLSKKSKQKIELIRRLKSDQNDKIILNGWIGAVNLGGSLIYTPFFYYSSIIYGVFSQFSLLNDIYTLRTGKRLANLPYNSISELYLKVSGVVLLAISIRFGIRKVVSMVQTKEIVKKGD